MKDDPSYFFCHTQTYHKYNATPLPGDKTLLRVYVFFKPKFLFANKKKVHLAVMQSDLLNLRKCPDFISRFFFGKEILSMIAVPREMNTIDYILDEIGIHQGFCQIMADILKPIPVVM